MTTHNKHQKNQERGPYGCADGVYFVHTCTCGAERRECSCYQCQEQGTSRSPWTMPFCNACKYHHPVDQSCPVAAAT